MVSPVRERFGVEISEILYGNAYPGDPSHTYTVCVKRARKVIKKEKSNISSCFYESICFIRTSSILKRAAKESRAFWDWETRGAKPQIP